MLLRLRELFATETNCCSALQGKNPIRFSLIEALLYTEDQKLLLAVSAIKC